MECSTNLPQAAFFSAEEKVQLISGNCPRHITEERLKEWLSFRKGTAKFGLHGLKQRRLSYLKGTQIAIFFVPYNYCHCLKGISKHKFYIDLFYLPQGHQLYKKWLGE